MRTTRILITVLVLSIMLTFLSACNIIPSIAPDGEETTDINPLPEAANTVDKEMTLYFKYADENMLAGETRVIDVPVNERIEMAVLEEVLKGPSQDNPELKSVIPKNAKIIDVNESGEYLFVTLSKEFITESALATVDTEDVAALETAKQDMNLAIYSIVDTLIELGGFSRIQILVDTNDSGRGERISLADIGDDSTDGGTLEPLGWNGVLLMTPENTVELLMEAFAKRDYETLYALIAYNSSDGTSKPSREDFISNLLSQFNTLEEYQVLDSVVSSDANSVIVAVSFSLKSQDGDTTVKDNIILQLIRERDLWKAEYTSFEEVFFE